MKNQTTGAVNVAPLSTSGHFVEKAQRVISLDDRKETFAVFGKAVLTTANHKTLQLNAADSCLITAQQVVNPATRMLERAMD